MKKNTKQPGETLTDKQSMLYRHPIVSWNTFRQQFLEQETRAILLLPEKMLDTFSGCHHIFRSFVLLCDVLTTRHFALAINVPHGSNV